MPIITRALSHLVRLEAAGLDVQTINAVCDALDALDQLTDGAELTTSDDGYGGSLRFVLRRLPRSWRVEGLDGGGEVVWTSLAAA